MHCISRHALSQTCIYMYMHGISHSGRGSGFQMQWRPIRRALTSQFNTSTHRRRSFRFPPRGAASGFRRCFRAASTARSSSFQLSLRSAGSGAQQLPARSSVRLNLKAQLLRRFHRAGPLAAASTTWRCFRRAAPSDARRTMRAGQHRPLQYLNYLAISYNRPL